MVVYALRPRSTGAVLPDPDRCNIADDALKQDTALLNIDEEAAAAYVSVCLGGTPNVFRRMQIRSFLGRNMTVSDANPMR